MVQICVWLTKLFYLLNYYHIQQHDRKTIIVRGKMLSITGRRRITRTTKKNTILATVKTI
jgi:hypothetical protein